MILRYKQLRQHPRVFQSMTGLRLPEFEELFEEVLPLIRRLTASIWKPNVSSAANRRACEPLAAARLLLSKRGITSCWWWCGCASIPRTKCWHIFLG